MNPLTCGGLTYCLGLMRRVWTKSLSENTSNVKGKPMIAHDTTEPLDKGQHYGEYITHERRQNDLYHKACSKALDIPEGEMAITQTGIGAKGIAGIVLASLMGPAAVAGVGLWVASQMNKPTEHMPPANSEYDVLFYDGEGKLIDIPQKK